MKISRIHFVGSVYADHQLPDENLPEIAFAGRSNVGKSSLINTLTGRKGLVKVSAKPGKTQALNFFRCDDTFHLVDLPGYGFARVAKSMQESWQGLITHYLETRKNLKCVVVILDIRHPPKELDFQLIDWLRQKSIPFLPVYTKADKLSGNERSKYASLLDAGHSFTAHSRILFSAKSGLGKDLLLSRLNEYITAL